jgi:PIN domain nuclease of toxin-antitoxin system
VRGYLFDTNAVLILGLQEELVPRSLLTSLAQEPRFVSQVCAIEIAIKHGIGKLSLPPPFQTAFAPAFARMVDEFSATLLAIGMDHIEILSHLPLRHRDPFDRLIISQALVEDLTIVTRDRSLADYDGVRILEL